MKKQLLLSLRSSPRRYLFLSLALYILFLTLGVILINHYSLNSKTRSSVQQSPSLIERKITELRPDEIAKQASFAIMAEKEWEIYVDPFYGYSIQYPKGWYLRPTPVGAAWYGGVAHIATFDPTINDSKARRHELADQGYVKIDIGVSMTPKLPSESLEDWLARREDPTAVQGAATMERITVKGSAEPALAKVFAPDTPNLLSRQVIYIPKADKVYYISVFEFPSPSQYHELIDQILATFSLEPTPLSD